VIPLYTRFMEFAAPLILSVFFTFKCMKFIRTAIIGLIIAELILWQFHMNQAYTLGLFLIFHGI